MWKHALAVALSLAAFSGIASAQVVDPAPAASSPGVKREGFIWGFSLGSGFSSTFRPAFSLHIGGMARPNLAVVLETYTVDKPGNEATHTIIAAGAQYWPRERVWVKAGVGYGSAATTDVGDEDSAEKIGAMGGAGYEVVRTGRFTLDVQLRAVATSGADGSASLNMGFNWY